MKDKPSKSFQPSLEEFSKILLLYGGFTWREIDVFNPLLRNSLRFVKDNLIDFIHELIIFNPLLRNSLRFIAQVGVEVLKFLYFSTLS